MVSSTCSPPLAPSCEVQEDCRGGAGWLGIIIGLAALVRLAGITWGLPNKTHLFSYHPDEYFSLNGAFQLILFGDPNPRFFNYPSLYLYLAAGACALGHGAMGLTAEMAQLPQVLRAFTLDARLMTVLLALTCIGATYGAACRLGGRAAGLWAAAIVAFAPGHVLYSHFAAVDVPLTCFMMLTTWAALVLRDDPRPRALVIAGIGTGAAAATKYNGALVLLIPLLCLGLRAWQGGLRQTWPQLLFRGMIVTLIAAMAFAVFSPYVLLDWPTASQHIAFERHHMRTGDGPARLADPNGWGFYFGALAFSMGGTLPLVSLLIGSGCAIRRNWRGTLPLLLLAFLWFAMISLTGVRYARYTLPLVPLLAVLVATSISKPIKPIIPKALFPGLVVLGGLLPTLLLSGSMAFGREPRDAALAWINTTIPSEAIIGSGRTIWFDMPPLDYNNGGDALGGMEPWRSFRRPIRTLVVGDLRDAKWLRNERPDWFIETDLQTQDWLRAHDRRALAFRRTLEELYTPAATFQRNCGWWLWGLTVPQPHDFSYPFTTIRIWRAKHPKEWRAAPTNSVLNDGSADPSNSFGR
ncbi:MAG: ArnT family glycosyltransferase [Candidatus Zipacnadales bacterium]